MKLCLFFFLVEEATTRKISMMNNLSARIIIFYLATFNDQICIIIKPYLRGLDRTSDLQQNHIHTTKNMYRFLRN